MAIPRWPDVIYELAPDLLALEVDEGTRRRRFRRSLEAAVDGALYILYRFSRLTGLPLPGHGIDDMPRWRILIEDKIQAERAEHRDVKAFNAQKRLVAADHAALSLTILDRAQQLGEFLLAGDAEGSAIAAGALWGSCAQLHSAVLEPYALSRMNSVTQNRESRETKRAATDGQIWRRWDEVCKVAKARGKSALRRQIAQEFNVSEPTVTRALKRRPASE